MYSRARHSLAAIGAWVAALVAASGAEATSYTFVCLDNPSLTSWTVPSTYTTVGSIWIAIPGGGGGGWGKNPSGGRGWGSGAGGAVWAESHDVLLVPGATVAIQTGTSGAAATMTSGTGFAGGSNFLCTDMSCTDWNSPHTAVGALGAPGGYVAAGDNQGQCINATYGFICHAGGNGANRGASGAGAAGWPIDNDHTGDGGAGFDNQLLGHWGGGGGGAAGPTHGGSNGGTAAEGQPVGGAGGTAAAGGGYGGQGGTSQGSSYGGRGGDGSLFAIQSGITACLGPGGGGGSPAADNVGTDPLSTSGNPDGGSYGGGGGNGDLTGTQLPGVGGRGALFGAWPTNPQPPPVPMGSFGEEF